MSGRVLAGLLILALAACTSPSSTADSEAERAQTFEATITLAPGVAELQMQLVPEPGGSRFFRDLGRALGTGGVRDLYGTGLLSARIRNLSEAPLRFEMADVAHFHQHLEGLPRRAEIAPRASYLLELGSIEVNRYATEFPLDISFSIDDRPQTWAVTLAPTAAEP